MEEGEEHHLIGHTSGSESGPMVSATVGRAMTTLLSAKPKKLQDAISNLHSPPKIAALTVSMEQSLWFLHKYIGEAAETGEHLDQVLVPILQHTLTTRESKRGNSVLILLNWLFQDEVLFQVTVTNLAAVISRRDDRYVALGWCILGRSLIEYENVAKNVATNAIREKYAVILKIFCSCVTHLLSIICKGSNMHEGFELPTRLAVAAADFILSLTVALTRKDLPSNNITKRQTSSFVTAKSQPLNSLVTATNDRDEDTLRKASELPPSLELKFLLWNNLEELITLVKKLTAWSRKSRSLQAKGLERVLKWLKELKQHNSSFQDEAELQMLKTGSLLLSSCWKHYGMLLRLEDHKISQQHKELLEQYLSDNEQFANAVTEFGSQVSQVLISQLRCPDEEVINGAMSIFKAVVLGTNHTLSKRSMGDVRQMDALLPLLLNLLDERDAAAKAIVKLLAEYCSICSDSECLNEVLKRIGSKNVAQRRNAIDVLSDLIHVSTGSTNTLPQASWQDVANHLLECLGDEDQIIRDQAAKLIPMIDPPLVLSTLVDLSYSTQESVQISASTALVALLVNHKHNPEILCLLLDCLSHTCKSVEDWHVVVGPLIDKMLAEPSNALIVRFLSHISEYLAEAVDIVFNRLVSYMKQQKVIDECNSKWKGRTDSKSEAMKHEHCLFNRLCPLLIIRLLPLRVFDDLNSPLVYGDLPSNSPLRENRQINIEVSDCIAALMISRALSKSEFEDVRKLAAELCGRIHPEILVPILSSELEAAANAKDVFKIKVCLFSFCTSLMVRGNSTYKHPNAFRIRKTIHQILSWSSVDSDEISKAQHGCIDCLALMLCTEIQSPKSSKGKYPYVTKFAGTAIARDSVLAYVMNQLTGDKKDSSFESEGSDRVTDATARLSFRLCMANVLISACQKISDTGKKSFVKKIVPCVIRSIGEVVEPDIRAACVQILFSVAYHLKSSIFSHSNDLLSVALKSLRDGSQKERMAGAKLVMCLMASEEDVVESISAGLLEARALLQKLSSTEPSPDVRQICRQLVVYLTSR
ncbi:hypothetical protein MIMGU_mgv1a000625mg [Erythranthe guttata]|uniref:Uncharacterized protein n=1 Tax=Erythranthe guttata TaxID=4155 RepID=A0A022PVB8_ERYGU|nr:hypothetical protein MIMGU_mgv1a000625mg [Erythranthe guttata]